MKWMAPASGIEVCHVGCCEYSQQEEPSISSVALHRLDLKSFGQRIAARDPDRKTAEIHISVIRRLSRTHGVRLLIHESLQCPRHRQDHPGGMNLRGKGALTSQAGVAQQSPSAAQIYLRMDETYKSIIATNVANRFIRDKVPV